MTQQRVSPITVTSQLPAVPTLSLQGAVGQSANLVEVKNSTGTVLSLVDLSGNLSAPSLIPSGSTVPTNGVYLPAANTLGLATNSGRSFSINAAKEVDIGSTGPTAGSSLQISKNLTGATTSNSFITSGNIQNDVTASARLFRTYVDTQNTNFALPELAHIWIQPATTFANVTAGGSVTNQYGVYIAANLTGATNNYGFYGNITAATGRWNVYMAASAANYFAGQTTVGSTSLTLGSGSVAQQFGVVSGAATTVGAVIRGAASQTADALQVQNSAGTVLASTTVAGIALKPQPTPIAKTASATLLIADLLTGIVTSTSATAVALTLPTGTLSDGGFAAIANDQSFDWSVINLGSASGAVTMTAGTAHTYVGNATVAINTSARFTSRRTAATTWVTYRIS